MMDPLRSVENLAVRARLDSAPSIQVRNEVLARISKPSPFSRLFPLSVFSAAAAIAASVVLAAGVYYWFAGSDPMAELVVPLQMVSIW